MGNPVWMNKLTVLLSRLYDNFLLNLHAFLSFVIPKKKDFYVFLPLHDQTKLSGNLRAFLVYLQKEKPHLQVKVVAQNKKLLEEAQALGIKSEKPIRNFSWSCLRAEYILTDASIHPLFRKSRLVIIQLWHGVGFKNVALLNDNLDLKTKRELKKVYQKYELLISSSPQDCQKKKASFGVKNTVITGSPRNDVFFHSGDEVQRLKEHYELGSFRKIIAYAPTFRDFPTKPPFSDLFWKDLQKFLAKEEILFAIKKHPWDKYFQVPSKFKNIVDISEKIKDPQELLLISDILISDYSSISTDFALTGKPILCYVYDLEEYKSNCRSIYYNLEKVLPKPLIRKEEELLEALSSIDWFADRDYMESYKKFQQTFHTYLDGHSSERVLQEIVNLKG